MRACLTLHLRPVFAAPAWADIPAPCTGREHTPGAGRLSAVRFLPGPLRPDRTSTRSATSAAAASAAAAKPAGRTKALSAGTTTAAGGRAGCS